MAWFQYERTVAIGIILFVANPWCSAQDDASSLRNQITRLTAENRELRNLVSTYRFTLQMQNGVVHESRINEAQVCKLSVAREGWGNCSAVDVAAVCGSCAQTLLTAIPPHPGSEPTIMVLRDPQGPMAVSQPGITGEHFVLLNSGDRRWAQIAYQFSHELGHVLCGKRRTESPQMWFEEAFCESLSLWTMDRLGVTWQTAAPYENWKSYAGSLSSYSDDVRKRVTEPDDLRDWFREHRDYLAGEAHDRDKNLVVAKHLAAAAHDHPDFYRAFIYLRPEADDSGEKVPMETLLVRWQDACPADLKFAASRVAELLGLELDPADNSAPGSTSFK